MSYITTITWQPLDADAAVALATDEGDDERPVYVLSDEPLWIVDGGEAHMIAVEFRRQADGTITVCVASDGEVITDGALASLLGDDEAECGLLLWGEIPQWQDVAAEFADLG
jgi:hypothetical protein